MARSAPEEINKVEGRAKRAVASIITALLVVCAVFVFIYMDLLPDFIPNFLRREANEASEERFVYDAGSQQTFAPAGTGLAVASVNGFTLIDSDGRTAANLLLSVNNPAIASSGTRCAFYDIGGTTLRVVDFDGNITIMDTKNTIISVTVNESGWMAVTREEPGYRGRVTVYNTKSEPVYEWYSGSGYVIKAVVSPDCREMAALCLTSAGSRIAVYALSDETEKSSFPVPDELLLDLYYVRNGLLCSLSERRAMFTDSSGNIAGSFDFGGFYLTDYEFGGDAFIAVLLSRYRSGNAITLVTVDYNGEVTGKSEMQRDLLSLSAKGNRLSALYADGLELYSSDLSLLAVREDVLGIKKALLRSRSEVLLLSAYSATPYSFAAS